MNPRTTDPLLDRDLRQRDLVPPERLAPCCALVIGVGAIGRQVAMQLAALGIPQMTLYDDDLVAVVNLAAQGYWPEDLNSLKVQATQAVCRRINPQTEVTVVGERFKRSTAQTLDRSDKLAVFACVDRITTRKLIWEALRYQAAFYVDSRMSAEVVRVLASDCPAADESYAATLFEADQAYAGSCTARSTIYTASIAAGLMVGQFTKWLRVLPTDPDLTLNLLASELTVPSNAIAGGN
jgi:sulfur carrier protein ThiS adenylyltransferase